MKRVYFSLSLLKSQTANEWYFRIWISLVTFFSCIPLTSLEFYLMTRIILLANARTVRYGPAHVPHILTSCTAEMDLTTENENLLSHIYTHTYIQSAYNDSSSSSSDNDNDDQAHAGQNVCFSSIDLDSVEHARNVCTWYKSKNAMKQFKCCEQKICRQQKKKETNTLTSAR